MAPKQRSADSSARSSTPSRAAKASSSSSNTSAPAIVQGVWDKYVSKTPQRTKLLDVFLVFLMAVGALQFAYVVLVGNFVRLSLFPPPPHHLFQLISRC